MLKVGITGGMGAGKSAVSKRFNDYCGIEIYDSDRESKKLVDYNENLKLEVENLIGPAAYFGTHDGRLNRKYVAEKIFNDDSLRFALQSIVSPYLWENFDNWCKNLIDNGYDKEYVIFESAIIIESDICDRFDSLIVVLADKDLRVERLMEHRNFSKELALERINVQTTDTKRLEKANFVIRNEKEFNVTYYDCDDDMLEKEGVSNVDQLNCKRVETLKKRIEHINHKIKYISYDTDKKR